MDANLLQTLERFIAIAPVIAVLIVAWANERTDKAAHCARADKAEARVRAVLRQAAKLPPEVIENGD